MTEGVFPQACAEGTKRSPERQRRRKRPQRGRPQLSCASSFSLFSIEVPISLPRTRSSIRSYRRALARPAFAKKEFPARPGAGGLIFEHQGSERAKPNRIKRR